MKTGGRRLGFRDNVRDHGLTNHEREIYATNEQMRNCTIIPSILLTQRCMRCLSLSSSNLPSDHFLRRIEVDLRPYLPNPIIAYERNNLEDDEELLERALGVQQQYGDGNDVVGDGKEVDSRASFHNTLGLHAWPSGFLAAKTVLEFLSTEKSGGRLTHETKVLELGCGTGIPSLAAYAAGASVIATDLDVEIISYSFRELMASQRSTERDNAFRCMKLDLLDKKVCEEMIRHERPNLVSAADCLYDATLAKVVGETMGNAVNKYGCAVVVADPGRLDGKGRQLFLNGFFDTLLMQENAETDKNGFDEVAMPQELLKATGASLSWCGVLETKVGIFTWPRRVKWRNSM